MIVIPMAGESRRFREAGYRQPKYMLPLQGRPLFDWTVLSFARQFATEKFLFIARDLADTAGFLRDRLDDLGLASARVVMLERATAGQAETVELGLQEAGVAAGEPLVIFNIDTLRPGFELSATEARSSWLEVFRGEGDHWSFIEPMASDPSRVARCTEKVRISDLCCTGLYAFSSAESFHWALAEERKAPSSHELFIAPIYNHLIRAGHPVGWREVPLSRVLFSGVPDEYRALDAIDVPARYPD